MRQADHTCYHFDLRHIEGFALDGRCRCLAKSGDGRFRSLKAALQACRPLTVSLRDILDHQRRRLFNAALGLKLTLARESHQSYYQIQDTHSKSSHMRDI